MHYEGMPNTRHSFQDVAGAKETMQDTDKRTEHGKSLHDTTWHDTRTDKRTRHDRKKRRRIMRDQIRRHKNMRQDRIHQRWCQTNDTWPQCNVRTRHDMTSWHHIEITHDKTWHAKRWIYPCRNSCSASRWKDLTGHRDINVLLTSPSNLFQINLLLLCNSVSIALLKSTLSNSGGLHFKMFC